MATRKFSSMLAAATKRSEEADRDWSRTPAISGAPRHGEREIRMLKVEQERLALQASPSFATLDSSTLWALETSLRSDSTPEWGAW